MFQNRDQDKGSDSGGKAAVVQHQTTVKETGGGAQGSTQEAGGYAGSSSVAAYDGTESGCESHAVYVSLGRQGPRDIQPGCFTHQDYHKVEDLISQDNGPYIFRVLSHGSESEGCKDYTYGRAGKSCAACKMDGQV